MENSVEIVRIYAVDPDTGEATDDGYFGVAASGRYGSAITRSTRTMDELRELVGDLHDPKALWSLVEREYPALGTWDGELSDPLAPPGD